MKKNLLNRIIVVTQAEKDSFDKLDDYELRRLIQEYISYKQYLHASYISRLILRRRSSNYSMKEEICTRAS